MIGVKEILIKMIRKEPLIMKQCIALARAHNIDGEVLDYLAYKLRNLVIEINSSYKGTIFDLMSLEKLLGYCWETTETAIMFLDENDYIERGTLHFILEEEYEHSWICFCCKNVWYVFDPCLNLLCKKTIYDKVFKTEVKVKISAKNVKDFFIDFIQNPKERLESEEEKMMNDFLKSVCPNQYERQQRETRVEETEGINSPMYRNNSGYIAEIKEDQIRKLTVHYYDETFLY